MSHLGQTSDLSINQRSALNVKINILVLIGGQHRPKLTNE